MLRADLQQGDSADQREGLAGEGASLVPLWDSDVVRDGDTYYLVINNLGERCLARGANRPLLNPRSHCRGWTNRTDTDLAGCLNRK